MHLSHTYTVHYQKGCLAGNFMSEKNTIKYYRGNQLSYDHCTHELPLLGETIPQCLDRIAATHPFNEAVVSIHQNQRHYYSVVKEIVDNAAKAFIALGIKKGDRVAIWSTNNFEWWVTQFATAKIGAILVNINPAYRTHELEYVLKSSRASALLLIENFKSSNYVNMFYEICPEAKEAKAGFLDSWRFPHLKSVVFIGRKEYPGMLTRKNFYHKAADIPDHKLEKMAGALDIDDVINIQYTSGTTGYPKGVMLTHNNILNNAYFTALEMGLGPGDRLCVPVPFYHCFGMVLSNMACMTVGATLVIPGPVFNARETLEAVHKEHCTALHGVPTMFIAELEDEEFHKYDLRSLRTGIMAGAPCPVEVMRKVHDQMYMKEVLVGYGHTECSPIATLTRPKELLKTRVSTVGSLAPHEEIKIVDIEKGNIVPRGEQGEICFRGYHIMAGYDNMPKETEEAIDKQGWLHSGDLGTMDAEGFIKITGRLKEMVIRGGENLFPREIEEFLHTFDIINDVYVVGVPDKKMGEELLACIQIKEGVEKPTNEKLKKMCKGKIAHFKIPRYWLIMDEYPMTITGKIQKFKLTEIGIRELGISK